MNIVIVSNRLIIPKELEQFITILEMDYLDLNEIRQIILDFIAEVNISGIKDELIDVFSLAFKGLTEFEINNLLNLSYSQGGTLSRSDLKLIFDQKQQMIKKAGIRILTASSQKK